MGVFFNPAAGLTANRITYATGDGRLANSGASISGNEVHFSDAIRFSAGSAGLLTWGAGAFQVQGGASFASVSLVPAGSGKVLVATLTNSANGMLQLASHSALGGGLAFGTDATGAETIWRTASGTLRTGASFQAPYLNGQVLYAHEASDYSGHYVSAVPVSDGSISFTSSRLGAGARLRAAAATGWALPSGTYTRTAFDTATVTLPQLAERLAALIYDLHVSGNRHALLGL